MFWETCLWGMEKNDWVQHSVGNIPWVHFFPPGERSWRSRFCQAGLAGEIRKGPVSASCLQIVRKLHEITGVQHRQHSMGVSQLTTKSAGNWITANKNPTIDWDPSPRFAAHLCSGVFVLGRLIFRGHDELHTPCHVHPFSILSPTWQHVHSLYASSPLRIFLSITPCPWPCALAFYNVFSFCIA